MSVESIVEHLERTIPPSPNQARVLVIGLSGEIEIRHLPARVRVSALYGARWARAAIITPPPYGEIEIDPGLILAWGGGAPNPLASRLILSELDAGAKAEGEALVMRYSFGGIVDLTDQELLWLGAVLAGHPPVGARR